MSLAQIVGLMLAGFTFGAVATVLSLSFIGRRMRSPTSDKVAMREKVVTRTFPPKDEE